MRIFENDYVIELHSEDSNGKFAIKLFKEPNLQLHIEALDGKNNIFIDLDKSELNMLSHMVEKALKSCNKSEDKKVTPSLIPYDAEFSMYLN